MTAVTNLAARRDAVQLAEIHFPAHDDWLSREELDLMTPEMLVERISALKPLIAANALEAERIRRPVDAVWNALRKTGVFYHFVPKRYGGLEYGIETFIDYVQIVSEACASTGWVLGQCVEHNWGLAIYPKDAQDEIFSEFPYIVAPGVSAPPGKARPVPGGYRVDAHWKWGSGVMNADWIKGNVIEVSGGDTNGRPLQVIFPSREATILDVWFMDGMCGTGSNDIVVEDLFVPAHRVLNSADWLAGTASGALTHENPIYRIPMIAFLSLTTMIPAIGAARNALKFFVDYQRGRTSFGSSQKVIEKASAQMRLGRATMTIDAAEMVMRDTARQMMDLAQSGRTSDFPARARIRAQNNYAMELCREGIQTICEGAGASAHRSDNPLQRALRDVNVMASHVLYDWDASSELLGRALVGYEPNSAVW